MTMIFNILRLLLILHFQNNVQLVHSFSCHQRLNGYYADIEAGCKKYYMCHDSIKYHYKCPLKTLFNQRMLTCDHWFMVTCSKSPENYHVNALIGQKDRKFMEEDEIASRTPRTDIYSIPNAIYNDVTHSRIDFEIEPKEIIDTLASEWPSYHKKPKYSKKFKNPKPKPKPTNSEFKLTTTNLSKITSFFKTPNLNYNFSHNSETNSSLRLKTGNTDLDPDPSPAYEEFIANPVTETTRNPGFDFRQLQQLYEIPTKFEYQLDFDRDDFANVLSRNQSSYDVCLFLDLDQVTCHKSVSIV